ncbi:MAG: hypothetical protein ACRCUS_01950, partial [Anaerovoracaceae bacterium]
MKFIEASKTIEINGAVETVDLAKNRTKLFLGSEAKIDNLLIHENAKKAQVTFEKGSLIENLATYQDVKLLGEGSIESILVSPRARIKNEGKIIIGQQTKVAIPIVNGKLNALVPKEPLLESKEEISHIFDTINIPTLEDFEVSTKASGFVDGDGSEDNPFIIADAINFLNVVRTKFNPDGSFRETANAVCSKVLHVAGEQHLIVDYNNYKIVNDIDFRLEDSRIIEDYFLKL